MNEHIEEYLDYYVKLDNPQFAVMLNGKWGSGKTFFIKERIEGWKNKVESHQEDEIVIQPIYVSLFGISSLGMINEAIKAELNPLLYSKSAKFMKEVGKGILRSAFKINLDWNDDSKTDGSVTMNLDSMSLLKGDSDDIKGNKILVFDDLERCNVDIDDVFGYINRFVEHLNCKVVLICDESKFSNDKSKSEKYTFFKEKLIGRTFLFKSEAEETVKKFILNIEKQSNDTYLSDNLNIITEVYHAFKTENLRSVQQALYDFKRLISYIDIEAIKDHKKFPDFIEGLLFHFLIFYFEFKNGHVEFLHLIPKSFFLKDESDVREKVVEIQNKYNELKKSDHTKYIDYIVHEGFLVKFIRDGWICPNKLNEGISRNTFFSLEIDQRWKELRSWSIFENDVFNEIFNNTWSKFTGTFFDNPYNILMISDIFLQLVENKIIDKSKHEVVEIAKQNIKRLFGQNEKFKEGDTWTHEYKMRDSESYKLIKSCFEDEEKKSFERMESDFVKNLFENMTSKSLETLPFDIDKTTPSERKNYKYYSFFHLVDTKKTAHSILGMTAKGVNYFKHFLKRRYDLEPKDANVALDPSYSSEYKFFKQLRKELKGSPNNYDAIKNYQIKELRKMIKLVMERIENI